MAADSFRCPDDSVAQGCQAATSARVIFQPLRYWSTRLLIIAAWLSPYAGSISEYHWCRHGSTPTSSATRSPDPKRGLLNLWPTLTGNWIPIETRHHG